MKNKRVRGGEYAQSTTLTDDGALLQGPQTIEYTSRRSYTLLEISNSMFSQVRECTYWPQQPPI
jgi:hypothetical protein